MRCTKIVCTLGPSSDDEATIRRLIDAGMDTARLNFSHGDHDAHRALTALLRRVAEQAGRPVAVLQDLQGPKIRVGQLAGGKLELRAGSELTLLHGERSSVPDVIPCSYPDIAADLSRGDSVLLDDGRLRLTVVDSDGDRARCRVVVGGLLSDHKGINLPGVQLSTPALTEKDLSDLQLGLELEVDYVALSFVRRAQDVARARELCGGIPLIAKIEKAEGVENIEPILEIVDGIMVARGDLGVEIGPERVPLIQKRLIEQTNARGLLVITATEMLDSMRHSPRPTRAEASDVANAVLDGTDAVMLSGETAAGRYPVEAVNTMDRIICEIEGSARYYQTPPPSLQRREISAALARAVVTAARELEDVPILCFTESGSTAVIISEYRPRSQLIAATSDRHVYRRLALHWGVTPLLLDSEPSTAEEAIRAIVGTALARRLIDAGQRVVLATGSWRGGPSDLIKILDVSAGS